MNQMTKRGVTCLAIAFVALLAGCKGIPVQFETIADPDVQFAPAPEFSVAVVKVRAAERDRRDSVRAIPHEELGLEGRQFIAAIERGFRGAGFELAEPDQAQLLAFCSDTVLVVEYDTYRRVPGYRHMYGSLHFRHGIRAHYDPYLDDIYVPERRRYIDRLVQISVHTNDPARDPMTIDPEGPSDIWIGRIRGRKTTIDDHLDALVRELLEDWGRAGRRTYRLPRS